MRMHPGLALSALLLLAACASKPKAPEPTPPPAIAAPEAAPPAPTAMVPAVTKDGTSIVACEKGKDHRSLDLRSHFKGCELAYTKGGQAAVVASSKHGFQRCEAAMTKIKAKLTSSGYDCK